MIVKRFFIPALALSLLCGARVLQARDAAQLGGETAVKTVVSSAAIAATGGSLRIDATIGQPIIGIVSSAESFLQQGFWTALSQTSTSVENRSGYSEPAGFNLSNHPNPFRAATTISFTLDRAGSVQLRIFNALGQTVRSLQSDALLRGMHSFSWDGRDASGVDVPSGAYFYSIGVAPSATQPSRRAVGTMMIVR